MKNNLLLWGVFILLGIGCQSEKIEIRKENLRENNENWEVDIQWPVFSAAEVGMEESCEILNTRIRHFIDTLKNNLKKDADTFFKEYSREGEERPAFNYQLYVRDSVFMAERELIII